MSALEIIGIIVAVIMFFAFFFFMCVFIALGILQDEDPKRAEELIQKWLEQLSRNDNNMNL